jgi:putative intracellular protease/amidase
MTHTGPSGGHAGPAADRPAAKDHQSATGPRPRRFRRILGVTGTVLLTVLALATMLVAGAIVTGRGMHEAVPTSQSHSVQDTATTSVGITRHGRPIVVAVVAGASGTVASDLLAPYDIFASSAAFHPYVVSAHADPVPLEGGPAVVPTHTFADVDADPALRPDLVVVPALSKPTGTTESALRRWVTTQHDRGAKVLGVCAGAVVLADTGLLDGLHATSHWSRISALAKSRPAVHWVRGRRWVEDGSVTTTAAVSSGVPGALHLVAELAGPAEAQRVADLHPELGWTPGQSTAIAKDHFAIRDVPVGLNFVEPWFRPTVGIALDDGVDELDATAAFEVYTQSAAARTVALSTGQTVRTRHGLTLLTTSTHDVPSLTRIVVPGVHDIDTGMQRWAVSRHIEIEPLRADTPTGAAVVNGGGFAAALQNLTDHSGATTAASTAKMIGYPTTHVDLQRGHHMVTRAELLLAISVVLAVTAGLAPALASSRRRRRAAARGEGGANLAISPARPRPRAS